MKNTQCQSLKNISMPVSFFTDSNGKGESYIASNDNSDLSNIGYDNTFSSVSLPPQTKVVMYSDVNYTGTKLIIGNGSSETLLVDFTNTIGAFSNNIHTNMSWDGINFNDRCSSFQLYENIDESCGCSFFEFNLSYTGEADQSVYLYADYFGQNYLTYFYADDSNFGPEHNDSTSSLLVFGNQYAYLYQDNNYAGGVSGFNGSGNSSVSRIYNLDGNVSWLNDTASSIKVGFL